MPVDFLAVGHVTRDLASNDPESNDYTLGGTASFAAVTATKLGRHATVITRAAADMDLSALPAEATLHILPTLVTTTFANIYSDQGRIQYCYTPAAPIQAGDILPELRRPKVALLGPVANEIDADVAALFDRDTLVGAVPQGWLRSWDETGRVHSRPWLNAASILPHLDAVILSWEDIEGDLSRLDFLIESVPVVVLTVAANGSVLYRRETDGSISVTPVPPRPVRELRDPTGAGDIFATAFLLRWQETGDPRLAARYANVTASFGIEDKGLSGIPTHHQVMDYLEEAGW